MDAYSDDFSRPSERRAQIKILVLIMLLLSLWTLFIMRWAPEREPRPEVLESSESIRFDVHP